MKNKSHILYLLALALAFVACEKTPTEPAFVGLVVPEHFPALTYAPADNPITEAGFKLGRKLFYDGRLSRDGTISCGTCHSQYSAFTHHGHDVSHGIDDRLGTRNTPAIQNMAFLQTYFWDGGVHNLDMVSFAPIENPVEMDETVANILPKLAADPEYRQAFADAFGDESITTVRMMQALAQFMAMLVSANSRYDDYIKGDASALSSTEITGLALFREKCGNCHQEPLFTDHSYRNNGLFRTNDKGRFHVSLLTEDEYKFKVPSLRNLGYTAPYMHDGRFQTLDDVLNHYQSGINAYPTVDSSLGHGVWVSDIEKQQIKAFLLSLDDSTFVRDPRFSEQ
jgi:cytochrome c peroxidase